MNYKKGWSSFQALVKARSDYRAWLYCEDPEEQTLRRELLELLNQLNHYAAAVQRTPMPTQMDELYLSRSSAHINRRISFESFVETLFENCLRQDSDKT